LAEVEEVQSSSDVLPSLVGTLGTLPHTEQSSFLSHATRTVASGLGTTLSPLDEWNKTNYRLLLILFAEPLPSPHKFCYRNGTFHPHGSSCQTLIQLPLVP